MTFKTDIWNAIFDDSEIPRSERYRVTLSPELGSLYELAKQHGYDSSLDIKAHRNAGGYGETVGYVVGMNLDSASPIEVINLFEYFVRRRVPLEKVLSEAHVEKTE